MKKSILILMAMAAAVSLAQTQQQAEAGRALYSARCATCHGVDLGGGEGPQLSGANFMASWGTRSSKELITYIQASMPPGTNKLGEQDALNAASFVLAANGVAPGTEALAATTTFVIRARGNGKPAIPLAAGGQVAAAGAGPQGITVAGKVKNYVPVTDAMLRNPDPGDWLMIRRNYQAWSYSPLNADQHCQREGSATGVVVGHERWRRERAHADRPQRHHVSGEHRQHRAGAGRAHGRADLGESHRPEQSGWTGRDAQPGAL